MTQDLRAYKNSWYHSGRNSFICAIWFIFGLPILRSKLNPSSVVRRLLLRSFGAQIGAGVCIKPGVEIKYPWHLLIGDNSWIGENAWIDNLCSVTIGSNACISQGAYLCTGNHDWSSQEFSLIVKPIIIRNEAWVGAKSVIGPGVEIGEGAVSAAGSVVSKNIPPYEIHAGNPAKFLRHRPSDSNLTAGPRPLVAPHRSPLTPQP